MKRVIGKINPADKNVSIWGAGFSGLVLAHYLKDQGYKVTVFERSNRVGGKIETVKVPCGQLEKGANALYMNADGMDLLKELKLEPMPAMKKLRRFLVINGKLKRPAQLGILSKVILNGNKKPPLISDGLTVAEFFRPLLGTFYIDHFVSPILGGIYAATAEQLHFKSIFHELAHGAQFKSYWAFIKEMIKNQKAKPRLEVRGSVSFEGGMQALIQRLADTLRSDIKLNYKEAFKIRGNTIICTDAMSASELLAELRPEISSELSRIKYQSLGSMTVFLKREIKSLQKSFGALIPLNSGFNSIGVINNKAIFPANHPNIYSYTFVFKKDCSQEDIQADLKKLYSAFLPEDIEHMEGGFSERGIPLYNLQRFLSIKKIHQLMEKEQDHLALFGNYVAGISLREMISAAKKFARDPQHILEK